MPKNAAMSLIRACRASDEGLCRGFRHYESLFNPPTANLKELHMKHATRWIPILAAISVLAAACDRAPTDFAAPTPSASAQFSKGAERVVQESLYDLTDSYFAFSCSATGEVLPIGEGELVRIEGQIFERITYLIDGGEGMHFKLNTMPVGLRGTGEASGEEFRIKETERAGSNSTLAGGSGSYRQELKMVGKATGRTFWIIFSGRYRFDGNGDVQLTRDKERVECKGSL
jgi:hypothetical protein